MIQILFRIVINWTCKCLGKLCKIVLNEVIEIISEETAKRVVSKLLRQDKNQYHHHKTNHNKNHQHLKR